MILPLFWRRKFQKNVFGGFPYLGPHTFLKGCQINVLEVLGVIFSCVVLFSRKVYLTLSSHWEINEFFLIEGSPCWKAISQRFAMRFPAFQVFCLHPNAGLIWSISPRLIDPFDPRDIYPPLAPLRRGPPRGTFEPTRPPKVGPSACCGNTAQATKPSGDMYVIPAHCCCWGAHGVGSALVPGVSDSLPPFSELDEEGAWHTHSLHHVS